MGRSRDSIYHRRSRLGKYNRRVDSQLANFLGSVHLYNLPDSLLYQHQEQGNSAYRQPSFPSTFNCSPSVGSCSHECWLRLSWFQSRPRNSLHHLWRESTAQLAQPWHIQELGLNLVSFLGRPPHLPQPLSVGLSICSYGRRIHWRHFLPNPCQVHCQKRLRQR